MRLLLFLYPLFELWSLIELAIRTSGLIAIFWVITSVVLGGSILRWAGANALRRLAEAHTGGMLIKQLILTDLAVIVAACLFIVPGLISDAFALLILIKPIRLVFFGAIINKASTDSSHPNWGSSSGTIIEGEFESQAGNQASIGPEDETTKPSTQHPKKPTRIKI